jgi:prepilin-type N-terminal cleavage/methylation domain-containing protein
MKKQTSNLNLIIIKYISKDRGLTLVEVLVATLIVVLFIGIALQALTVAAVFKSRARIQNDAISWIQEDLEKVREQATTIASDPTNKCKVNNPNDGYANQLQSKLPPINSSNEIRPISGLDYKIVRTPNIPGSGACQVNTCYEVLSLSYQVKGTGGQKDLVLAEVDTEVIPNAAFECPL